MSLAAFPLTHLDLNYAVTFNDTGMASLKGKTTLQRLYLRGTSITDAGIQNLSGLTNLVELDLSDVVDDRCRPVAPRRADEASPAESAERGRHRRGLDVLKNMPELEELSLYRTKVSNAGLAKLSGLEESAVRRSALQPRDQLGRPRADVEAAEGRVAHPRVVQPASRSARWRRRRSPRKGDAAIAEWLRAIGGKVQMADGAITAVSLNGTSITDKEFVVLTKLPQLKELQPAAHGDQHDRTRAARGGPLARAPRPRPHAARRQRAADARVADEPARARSAEHAGRGHGARRAEGAAEPARDRSGQRADSRTRGWRSWRS